MSGAGVHIYWDYLTFWIFAPAYLMYFFSRRLLCKRAAAALKTKTTQILCKQRKERGLFITSFPPPSSNEARQFQANSSTLLSAPCWKKQRRPAPKHSMCLVLVMVLLLVYAGFSTRAVFRLSLNQQTIGIRFKFSYTDVRGVSRLSSNSWPESK